MDREQIYQELLKDHWEHVYNWDAIEARIEVAARRAKCSVETLREIMREIEQKYPKPKPKRKRWRDVEYTKPCRTCGTLIGFARTRKNKMMPVNLHDFTTHWGCEKPGKKKKQKAKKNGKTTHRHRR